MPNASPAIPSEVQERIIAVADELFEKSDRQNIPTVDAVRRAARVDMNAASAVMRQWRRDQTAKTVVAVAVPESVHQAASAAVANIWKQAMELANESLRSAQVDWQTERAGLDAMRQEMAEAFEHQARELEKATADLVAKKSHAQEQAAQLAAASSRADKAEDRLAQSEQQARELRAERDDAVKIAADARERAAELSGQLKAVQEQNAALLTAVKQQAQTVSGKTPPSRKA